MHIAFYRGAGSLRGILDISQGAVCKLCGSCLYVWMAAVGSFSYYWTYFYRVLLDLESSLLQNISDFLHTVYCRICDVGLFYRLQNFAVMVGLHKFCRHTDEIPGLIRLSYAINPSSSRILR